MATQIILKSTTGNTNPTLSYGELGICYKNGIEKLFAKNSLNEIFAFNDWNKIFNRPTSFDGFGITGGTLTGGLTGTSATFSSLISSSINATNLTSNYLPKHTSTGFSNSLLYDSGTGIGLGTTSVGSWKMVVQSQYPFQIKNSSSTSVFEFYADLKENRYLNGLSIVGYLQDLVINTSSSTYDLLLQPSGGTVGIGTSNPSTLYKLDVNGSVILGNSTTNGLTISNGTQSVTLTVDSNGVLKLDNASSGASFYATGEISAYGLGPTGGTGGNVSVLNINNFGQTFTSGATDNTFNAYAINSLHTRISNIESSGATSITTVGTGNAITSVDKTGNLITFTKGSTFAPSIGSTSIVNLGVVTAGTWSATDVALAHGGTNASLTASAGSIVYSTASAMAMSTVGTVGFLLTSNGTGAPTWTNPANLTVSAATKVTSVLTRGSYLTGSNYDGSAATTWAVDATTTNTASKIVARDGSGNFSAGTITASSFVGNASSATKLASTRTIWGQNFDGTGNVTGRFNLDGLDNSQFSIYNNGSSREIQTYGGFLSINPGGANVLIGTRYDNGYKLDVNGTARISNDLTLSGNLNFNTSANQINSTSAVELALNYAGGGARHTSIFDGQGNFIMRAHYNGNVGIGTSEPQYKLDVNGDIRSNYMYFKKYNDNGVAGYVGRGATNNNNLQLLSYSGNSVYIGANENDVAGITINTSNNVGIGTTSPSYKLDVNGSVRTGTIIIDEHVSDAGLKINNNSNTYSRIRFFDSDNNVGTIHAFTGNQFLFNNQKCINIDSMGAVSLGHWNEPNVYINTVNGCVGISNTNPQFKLDVNGSGHYASELYLDYGLRISNAAGSGEGISLFAESSTNPNYGLMFARTVYKGTHGAVNGDWATYFTMSTDAGRGWIFTSNASGTGGNVASISNWGNLTCSGEVTAYSASDIRLKTNIKPICSAIDVINKLNPVQYNWNSVAKELNPLKDDSTEYGLIAQELEKVMPELVHEIYGKYKSIDYVKLVPILIKAVQEQQIKIEKLEKLVKQNRCLS